MEVIVVAAGALLLIGFIGGYGARELISRLRRTRAERRRFERMVEEIEQTERRKGLATTFQRGDGARSLPDG